jgi:N-acetyl-anhydromuramyl-L-alanine amidase AmpD
MPAPPVALELEAEDLPPPLPPEPLPLAQRSPPAAWAQQVPDRPPASGRLDVPLGRRWDYIVIHHSDTASGNERVFDRYARNERGWLGVGYHFVIGNGNGSGDGEVEVTFRWEKQLHGAHAGVKKYNEHGVGICLVGDFERGHPTPRQMASLAALVNYLQERCRIPTAHILLHRHLKNTRCPGRNFPFYDLTALLDH